MNVKMKATFKQLLAATMAVVFVAAGSTAAWADGRGRDHGRSGYSNHRDYRGGSHQGYNKHKYNHNYGRNYYKPHYSNKHRYSPKYYGHSYRYYGPRYFGRPYYPYYYGHGSRYGHWHTSNSDGYFVLGAATGLMLGAAISQPREREVVYTQTTYVTPPPTTPYQGQYQASSYQLPDNCLQTREYTTTILVGGREEEAYGTACLQSDGSWLQGPPQLVPR